MNSDSLSALPIGSNELARALDSGVIVVDGTSHHVVPSHVDEANQNVVMIAVDPQKDRPSTVALWWRAIRPISLTATATPAIATLIYGGAYNHWPMTPWITVLALVGALFLQVCVNLINDVEDHRRLIDLPGGPGGAGVLQRGWLTASAVQRGALYALALGVLCGVPALLRAPVGITTIGALAVLGAFGYSGKPFGFKYRALGDVLVLVLCGPGMTLGMSFAAFGHASLSVAVLGLYFGLLADGILHANNLQDATVDRRRGATTLAHVLSLGGARTYFVLLYVLAIATPFIMWATGALSLPVTLATLLGLPLVIPLVRVVASGAPLDAPEHGMLRVRAAQAHLALGLLFVVALGIERVVR